MEESQFPYVLSVGVSTNWSYISSRVEFKMSLVLLAVKVSIMVTDVLEEDRYISATVC
jgi:hypothetical protein